MQIIMDKTVTLSKADEFLDCCQQIEDEIVKYSHIIDKINAAWEGEDALKYINNMRSFHVPKFNAILEVLNSYAEYLKKVPGPYETIDEVYATKTIDV